LEKAFYNLNNIHFYRITSKLVPLATHPEVKWDYRKMFKIDFERIGNLVKDNNLRVDTHPDQFNVINSQREDVVENTKITLMHHVDLFEDLGYPKGKMIIHVGSGTGGKEKAIERFVKNFSNYPKEITSRLIIENDDKVFSAIDVLNLCKTLNTPMVLDVHHHICNNDGENLKDLMTHIFDTWNKEDLSPKIHFSSPRDGEKDRKHADYIKVEEFSAFLDIAKTIDRDFDVMLEAKKKDLAVLRLYFNILYKSSKLDNVTCFNLFNFCSSLINLL